MLYIVLLALSLFPSWQFILWMHSEIIFLSIEIAKFIFRYTTEISDRPFIKHFAHNFYLVFQKWKERSQISFNLPGFGKGVSDQGMRIATIR